MKRIQLYFISTLLIILAGLFASWKSASTGCTEDISLSQKAKIEKIESLLSTYTSYEKFSGAVLVAEEGKVIYKEGFGLANREWDIANTSQTKFRIASITKQFTALLILQLVEEGQLDLKTPISSYLPDYPTVNAEKINIHHLLTHSSGIPEFDYFLKYRDIERDRYSPQELINIFSEGALEFEPGEKYAYSNPNYVILGHIIEQIRGKSYEEVLQERIFTPLEMSDSGYDMHYKVLKNRASGYSPGYLRGDFYNVNFVDMSIPYAAGSIYSTVEDLFKWDQTLYGNILLSEKYKKLLFSPHVETRGWHYAYGWKVGDMPIGNTEEKVYSMGHTGGINGFRSMITRIPSNTSTIIFLSNIERSHHFELTMAINAILHNKSYDLNLSTAYTTKDIILKRGIEEGLQHYKKARASISYYLDEHEMNKAGYEFYLEDKLSEAAALFRLNVEAFPHSGNVYDSYGEVLLKQGNKTDAIRHYQKSVELDPNNRNAIRILKDLGGLKRMSHNETSSLLFRTLFGNHRKA